MTQIAIGCSGFNYKHWRGVFYPEKLAQKKWFEHYFGVFSTVELNVTFYRLPKPETFDNWYHQTPPGFAFALKGSRFITHIKRLADSEEAVERYFQAALNLQEKLKVVLWQLAPGFPADIDRLHSFLQLLHRYPVRHVFEFRHPSWTSSPEVVQLCKSFQAALCVADWPEFLVRPPLTSNFVYVRRHGHDRSYTGCYSTEELEADAGYIREHLQQGRDVYVYFNNDIGGFAPRNALDLIGMLRS